MASVRFQILTKIRDTLDPLFPDGGCHFWHQHGNQLGKGVSAVVEYLTDDVTKELVGGADMSTARLDRDLDISVDIFCQTPLDEETRAIVDEQVVIAERALMTIDWSSVVGGENLLLHLLATVPFIRAEGQAHVGDTIRVRMKYQQKFVDPEAR